MWVVEMIETLKRKKVEAERSLMFEISLGYNETLSYKTKKQKAVYCIPVRQTYKLSPREAEAGAMRCKSEAS